MPAPTKRKLTAAGTAKIKKESLRCVTPVGKLVFPYLAEPDSGRQYSDDKFKTDILFPKETWQEAGKELRQTVLKAAQAFYGKPMKFAEFAHPFKDGDTKPQDYYKGNYYITAKSQFLTTVVGADKKEFSLDRIKRIKGGDFARLVVSVYPYTQGEGGITCGLEVVQFSHEGDALSGGRSVSLNMLDDLEVELEDLGDVTAEEVDENYVDDMDDITI